MFLEHKRRYTLAHLEAVARRAGLVLEQSAYYFGLVLPIAALTRFVGRWRHAAQGPGQSQLRKHSPAVNRTLTVLCQLELPCLRINRLAGLTVFCLARRP